jgi:putative transposase
MTKKKYQRYSPEFKRHALKRASEDRVTDKDVCEDLGISARQLCRWRDQYRLLGDEAFPGQGRNRDEESHRCGRHKVARLMRKAGLKGCPKRPFRVTTQRDPSHPVADNLLEQDFTASGPNERWASDITYISTHQGWLYLAVVMDLYSRRIVGWSMSRWINRHLVIDALNMAIGQRCPEGELIHHSDRGSQYTSDDFRDELEKNKIQCSMSARGNCYDNAVVESFFGLLKRERVNRTRYLTRDEAKQDIFDYIERFYNRKRRHSYLGNISPAAYEKRNQSQFQTVH